MWAVGGVTGVGDGVGVSRGVTGIGGGVVVLGGAGFGGDALPQGGPSRGGAVARRRRGQGGRGLPRAGPAGRGGPHVSGGRGVGALPVRGADRGGR